MAYARAAVVHARMQSNLFNGIAVRFSPTTTGDPQCISFFECSINVQKKCQTTVYNQEQLFWQRFHCSGVVGDKQNADQSTQSTAAGV